MSKLITALLLVLSIVTLSAQTQQVDLTQTPGVFDKTNLTLAQGQFQFNIINDGVDHEVGFVLVPKGHYAESDHIKEAYVKNTVAEGKNSLTSIVSLEAGEYEYFCPMNPTPKYALTVFDNIKTIELTQAPGVFTTKNVNLKSGNYQFNIINDGVDHEVGFVLVPKGKYDAAHHIKAAYVKAPVKEGKNSMTDIVTLKAGEYEYFCPMNPTDKYSLTVED